ncbi:MAG: acireductone synthase [Cyanobacteriota bacterium]|nr:acireductone synthase [Cyanobacteriota bacterium]
MINHLLLDIEGTTCPVSFVSEELFPYASRQLQPYIDKHYRDADISKILQSAIEEHNQDHKWLNSNSTRSPICDSSDNHHLAIGHYLRHLISIDKKSTALKDLQGRIWNDGYTRGEIVSTLFPEAAACLNEWKTIGLTLAVYSSGSIEAQQLLYQHTTSGNLKSFFSYWFDTHTGPKKESQSYSSICKLMQTKPDSVLFISDSSEECDAAQRAGLQTLFSRRTNNPNLHSNGHRAIESLTEVIHYIQEKRI